MIGFMSVLLLGFAQAYPNFLTKDEVLHEGRGPVSWECFHTSQIKLMECEEWVEEHPYGNSELSDMNLVVETDNAIYSYGFNNAHHVCRDIKKDMQDLLRGQKYFCMLADHFEPSDFELRGKEIKPVIDGVYKCLNTPIGKVGWFGEFGICLE